MRAVLYRDICLHIFFLPEAALEIYSKTRIFYGSMNQKINVGFNLHMISNHSVNSA